MSCNIALSTKQKQFGKFFCAVVVIVIIALAVDLTRSNGSHHTSSLKFVIVVTRHGTRGPFGGYPKDPYNSEQHWPDGPQGLTSIGKNQLYNIGITLRQLYDGFLNKHYLPSEFKAQSSPMERTLQSAGALLAGLYPPRDYQIWNKNLDWQPVPIYPNYLDKERLIAHAEDCPTFWKLQNESIKLNEDNSNETKKFIKIVSENSGLDATITMNLAHVWDALSCEYYNGMELPEWTKAVFPSPFDSISNKLINARLIANEKMTRLLAGLMMQAFVNSMQKRLNDTDNKEYRMLYYSSHDYTLKGLLSSFGFVDVPLVRFASTLLLELHSNPLLPSKHEIKLFQIDGTSTDRTPRGYDIPNCTSSCDFNQFLQLTKKYYDGLNWTKECQL